MTTTLRLTVAAALIVALCAVGVATAAQPRTGKFVGNSSQDTRSGSPIPISFGVVVPADGEGRAVRRISFPSAAKCNDGRTLRVTTSIGRRQVLDLGQLKIGGPIRGSIDGNLKFRGRFKMDGRFPTRRSAKGTWRLRAEVVRRDGGDRVTTCKTGRVGWRASLR